MKGQDVLDEGSRRRKTQEDMEADHEIIETGRWKAMTRYAPNELTNLSLSKIWNALAVCIPFTKAQ